MPSSNTTIEVELPELLRRREAVAPERLLVYACLAAIMTEGPGAHVLAEKRLLAAGGVQVVDAISLGVTDNEIGRYDPVRLIGLADQLDVDGADAVVLSVCVALPSLPAVPVVERRLVCRY